MALMLLSFIAAVSALGRADNATIQGFSREGLQVMNTAMHNWVKEAKGANVVTLLARHGQVVDLDAYGVLDASAATGETWEEKLKTGSPAKKDTIFHIMSMTKPTVGVAMMMFYEDGKWKLDDLVSKHIPEFANLQVKLANDTLVPQKTPMTMAQLMSHSAGFPAQLTVPSATLQGIIPPLVRGQLAFQPGTDWRYGPGVEIQGYLVEKWAGKDLSDFLQERLFGPLGMVDTGFFVDPSKANRVTKVHTGSGDKLASDKARSNVATKKPTRLSPSGGLYSTAEDYWRFCQMLLNDGEYQGRRYLKESSVKLMHTNVLQPGVSVKMAGSGDGTGFGLDFAIVMDQKSSRNNVPKDSYYWGGAYGTWFWIDPTNDVVFVGMIQNAQPQMSGDTSLRQLSAKTAYAALSR
jgi:CubicO group peptidase (beta-lactamase class C family)